MAKVTKESILDNPKATLDMAVWKDVPNGKPVLTDDAMQKMHAVIEWVQQQYDFSNLSVYIIGSICSNSYNADSDIDIDFCAPNATEDDNDEDAVKDFGWKFKENFNKNYAEKFPEQVKVGTHPFEVYFSPNPFQCFMSVGCYNVLEQKWEVGPELKREGFDPIAEYYADAMKQVDKILKDVRDKIFNIYEKTIVALKSNDQKFKQEQEKEIVDLLADASDLFQLMKKVRSNYQRPCKSKEEALKRRKDKKQHVVDAAFKFFDKFGYMHILKDFIDIYYKIKDGEDISQDEIFNAILKSVKDNISMKSLQDSEDTEFLNELEKADLNESAKDFIKISSLAAMLAIPNLVSAESLAKELNYAKKLDQHMTINSPNVKNAIANASTDSEMLGPMSKTNVVNAIAQVLWKEARGVKEGTAGRKAVASVILNRTGNDPNVIIDVLKEKHAFTCMKKYTGGWTDKTYQWYFPWNELNSNPANWTIWNECNDIALQLANKTFKSTIGNRNSYLNKATADADAVNTWGRSCDLKIGSHHFGYLKEHDPKIVKPGTMIAWRQLRKANNKIAKNPMFVTVKSGDTLGKIAKNNKTTVDKILALNKTIKDPNKIGIGQKIRVA